MRKVISIAAATMLAVGVLTACSSPGGESSDEPVTLDLLAFTTPNLDEAFWTTATERAASQVGPNVSVNVLYSPDPDRQAYARQLAATGQLPDIVWDVIIELAQAGDLLPYEEADFDDFVTLPFKVDGEYYGYPAGAQVVPMVYYNKEMFAEAGIEDAPGTWDEFLAASETLKAAGFNPIMVGGGADIWPSSILLDGILTIDVAGTEDNWVTKLYDGEVAWTDDKVLDAIAKWENLFDSGYTNSDALSLAYGQMQESFLAGGAAMYPMGSWAAAISSPDFEIGVFPLPGEDGVEVIPTVLGNSTAISSSSEHPDEAKALAHALATDKEFATASLNADALFPTLKAFEVPADTAPLIRESYQIYADAPKQVFAINWGGGDLGLPTAFTAEFRTIAQKVITGDLDASGATAALQAAWVTATAR